MATICLVYKPRLLYHTFISCTPNPLTIGYKSFSWCPSLSIFTFHTVLNPFFLPPPTSSGGPRTSPKAVTLSDIRIGANHPGLHPKAPPPLPNSILRYYPESKIWPSPSLLVSTSPILVPLLFILPSLNPLHTGTWMSLTNTVWVGPQDQIPKSLSCTQTFYGFRSLFSSAYAGEEG